MTDAQDLAGKPVARPVRPRREKLTAGKTEPRCYIAMHEVNAAMCLAGGILAPRFEQSAARDHHVAAGGLLVEPLAPSAKALLGAQGELSYGGVVLFEVPASSSGLPSPPSLPLWRATRLIFESQDAFDMFRARMSGYGDVPDDVLPMAVDAGLFSARTEDESPSPLEHRLATVGTAAAERAAEAQDSNIAPDFRTIDRCAGGLLAAASTLQGASAVQVIRALHGLSVATPTASPAEQFALAIALLADPSPDAATYAPVLSATARILSAGTMDEGFSAKALLRQAEPLSIEGLQEGSTQLQAIQKFWTFTKDVLELRRDVAEGAWSDQGGSAIARGTLLFMLNPEPEQLGVVRDRMPNVGMAVHFVAGLLVGIRSGLTRMGRDVKSARESFLAGAAFVHDLLRGQAPPIAMQRTWDPREGSSEYSLLFEGVTTMTVKEPADPLRVSLAMALRAAGVDALFAPDTGDLRGKFGSNSLEMSFEVVEAKLPTFPRQLGLEASTIVPVKFSRSIAAGLVAEVNAESREHCVSAQLVEDSGGRAAVRLHVIVLQMTTADSFAEAMAALVEQAIEVAARAPVKTPRRAKVVKTASEGPAGQESGSAGAASSGAA